MTKQTTIRFMKLGFAAAMLAGATLVVGCHKDRRQDIPEGALPQPLGTSTNEFFSRQAQVGETDAFVVYLYEWDGDGTDLDAWSQQRLHGLINQLPRQPYLLVVQPSDDSRLDDARRRALVAMVSRQGVPHADERVIVANPRADALYGIESGRIIRGIDVTGRESNQTVNTGTVVGGAGFTNNTR